MWWAAEVGDQRLKESMQARHMRLHVCILRENHKDMDKFVSACDEFFNRLCDLFIGFVNGAGAVNGFRLSYQQRRLSAQRISITKKLVAVAILVAVIVAVPYLLVYAFPKETVEIDGYFMDWVKAQMYRDTPDSQNPDIALEAYSMKYDSRGSYFYIETEGEMLLGRDNGVDGFYIFIDTDNNPASGYSVRGMGADAMVSVVGWNRTVVSSSSYVFDPAASRIDFGGFRQVSSAAVASAGNQMEIGSPLLAGARSRVAICAMHTNTTSDWSDVNFRPTGSAIEATQYFSMPSVLSATPEQPVLTIDISAKGPRTYVDSLRFDFLGNATPSWITATEGTDILGSSTSDTITFGKPFLVGANARRVQISAMLPTDVYGSSFGLRLNETGGILTDANATWVIHSVQTGSKVAYIGYAPPRIAIDGAFGDWASRAPIRDRLWDAYSNRTKDNRSGDVDISTVKVSSTADVASFYMAVNGSMLGGSSVPTELVRFVSPGPPAANVTNITERVYGSDFAFVFIDADQNQSTGYYVGGSEAALVVIGKGNSILTSQCLRYVRGAWAEVGAVEAAIDSFQLEMSAPYALLGLTPGETYTITFVAQDWSGRMDDIAMPLPARLGAGARAYPGIIINEIYSRAPPGGDNDWLEIYNSGTTPVTVGGWEIYADGVLVYTYPTVTIQPGQFYVVSGLSFGKATNYVLTDASGNIIDQVTTPDWQGKSYGRTGYAPWDNWTLMTPTPGAVNVGQILIPEFGHVLLPLSIVPIVLIAIRRARPTRDDGKG